jgi:hypothetical protein
MTEKFTSSALRGAAKQAANCPIFKKLVKLLKKQSLQERNGPACSENGILGYSNRQIARMNRKRKKRNVKRK